MESGLVKDRDDMRKLTLEQQKDLQIKSAEKVASMGNVILDTHWTGKTPKGYMPGVPEWIVKRINRFRLKPIFLRICTQSVDKII